MKNKMNIELIEFLYEILFIGLYMKFLYDIIFIGTFSFDKLDFKVKIIPRELNGCYFIPNLKP